MSLPRQLPPVVRRTAFVVHRDLGYVLSALLIAYCLSGLALNHVDDWNPDFVVDKREVSLGEAHARAEVDDALIRRYGALVGEEEYRVYDFPTAEQVKIYYADATLLVKLDTGAGEYERVTRRPIFFQTNLLHRNAIDGWQWVSDLFAVSLITVTVSGLVLVKGRQGLAGRGKWLVLLGAAPPLVALTLHAWARS